MGITQKEFARRMGVSPQAVNKRVRAGRLSTLADGSLDPTVAAQEWNATRGPSMEQPPQRQPPQREAAERQPPQRQAAQRQVAPGAAANSAGAPGSGGTYAQAKTADALYKARLRQLDYETRTGAYVRMDEVQLKWADLAQAIRARLMAIPQRLAAELAANTDVHQVRMRLDEEIRTALQELATDARQSAK